MEVGFYRFLLQVWTNANDFSQDTVHVYVHPYLNSPPFSIDVNNKEDISPLREMDIQDSLVQIEIDMDPAKFSEKKKEAFLKNLQDLLQQPEFKLIQPTVVFVSSKVSINLKKSTVLIEILVVENDFSHKADSHFTSISEGFTLTEYQTLAKSSGIVKALRAKRKNPNLFGAFLQPIPNVEVVSSTHPYESLELLGVKILNVIQPTSNTQKYSRGFNCSSHGKCDAFSHKCICDKYWMPNLYMYYFENKSDLTNGSNCGKSKQKFSI